MKALRTLTILFALALMCLPAPSAAAAEKPFKLDICAMPEHESFIFWYAKEQGWDKDEGLDFQIHFFQTGMDQLEALPVAVDGDLHVIVVEPPGAVIVVLYHAADRDT